MLKRDELLAFIAADEPDVIAITEAWANSSHLMTKFSIEGCESFHKNREHKKGGGVVCYVKSTLFALNTEKQYAKNNVTLFM